MRARASLFCVVNQIFPIELDCGRIRLGRRRARAAERRPIDGTLSQTLAVSRARPSAQGGGGVMRLAVMTASLSQRHCAAIVSSTHGAVRVLSRRHRGVTTVAADRGDRVCVVQGASRGLGLEVAKQLSERPGHFVYATCRDPGSATALSALAISSRGSLHVVRLDTDDEESVADAAAEIARGSGGRVDLLLSTSGALTDPHWRASPPRAAREGLPAPRAAPGGVPETSLAAIDPAWAMAQYRTNVVGPLTVLKWLAPLLSAGGAPPSSRIARSVPLGETPPRDAAAGFVGAGPGVPLGLGGVWPPPPGHFNASWPGPGGVRPSVAAFLSARVGSTGDNRSGGWYRCVWREGGGRGGEEIDRGETSGSHARPPAPATTSAATLAGA